MKSFLLFMLGLFLFGCDMQTVHLTADPAYKSGEVFKELNSPSSVNSYLVDGTIIEADIAPESKGLDQKILITSHGKVLDQEVYRITAKRFLLVEAAGEQFTEPIPLLEFPLSIGDSYQWRGQLTTASGSVPAQATILTENVTLSRKDKSNQAVMVTVKLKLENEQSEKRMALWFVPSEGLVKREFGTCIRERN
jgi:hypothetical protein